MPSTRDFRTTIRNRLAREPEFREALTQESAELIESGDEETARALELHYLTDPKPDRTNEK